jgi:hypothetical protein
MFLAPKDELETKNPMDEVFPTDHRWLFSETDQPVKVSRGELFPTATPNSNGTGALAGFSTKTGVWATGALDPDGPQAAISMQMLKKSHCVTIQILIISNTRFLLCDGNPKDSSSMIISYSGAKTPPSL